MKARWNGRIDTRVQEPFRRCCQPLLGFVRSNCARVDLFLAPDSCLANRLLEYLAAGKDQQRHEELRHHPWTAHIKQRVFLCLTVIQQINVYVWNVDIKCEQVQTYLFVQPLTSERIPGVRVETNSEDVDSNQARRSGCFQKDKLWCR